MANPIKVLLSFMPIFIRQLRDFGAEQGWFTSQNTLKNATIAGNIVLFILKLRKDPVVHQILRKESTLLFSLILRELNRHAAVKGYGIIFEGKQNLTEF